MPGGRFADKEAVAGEHDKPVGMWQLVDCGLKETRRNEVMEVVMAYALLYCADMNAAKGNVAGSHIKSELGL